jgi:hypothetical protein
MRQLSSAVLFILVLVVATVVIASMPGIQRYLRISSM